MLSPAKPSRLPTTGSALPRACGRSTISGRAGRRRSLRRSPGARRRRTGEARRRQPRTGCAFCVRPNEFAVQQQRLHAALSGANGGVDSVASLAALKSLLLPDEALVFYVPMAGQLAKICVRADRTVSSTQQVDGTTAATDARLLQAALTATHPPSIEADSLFPPPPRSGWASSCSAGWRIACARAGASITSRRPASRDRCRRRRCSRRSRPCRAPATTCARPAG